LQSRSPRQRPHPAEALLLAQQAEEAAAPAPAPLSPHVAALLLGRTGLSYISDGSNEMLRRCGMERHSYFGMIFFCMCFPSLRHYIFRDFINFSCSGVDVWSKTSSQRSSEKIHGYHKI
jgi:hypothetical protein